MRAGEEKTLLYSSTRTPPYTVPHKRIIIQESDTNFCDTQDGLFFLLLSFLLFFVFSTH